jgi:hypothetical protein
MTYHEELEAEIAALHRRVWELEYQLEAARLAHGLVSFPSHPQSYSVSRWPWQWQWRAI